LRIREQAFSGCNGITKITLGKGLEKICDYAFRGCTGIKTVNYGGSEADFAKVKIGSGNGYITSATITYGE
ncbi:MAG: leucine-rich repeat protein, partial [Candidatus Borkfalkiaceae bacterium]|nr:leucine-rich repeat protein [Christensenellaceae bacterium]